MTEGRLLLAALKGLSLKNNLRFEVVLWNPGKPLSAACLCFERCRLSPVDILIL